MAIFQAAQSFGFTVGPAIQAAFSPLGCSSEADTGHPYIAMDTYTACGWCTAFLSEYVCTEFHKRRRQLQLSVGVYVSGFLCLGLLYPGVFVEYNVTGEGDNNLSESMGGENNHERGGVDLMAILSLLLDQFVFSLLFVLMEA